MIFREPITAELKRAAFAEFLAMTIFVYIGTGSVVSTGEFLRSDGEWVTQASVARILPIAMAFGVAILVLVYGFGHISGGHINPAVTACLTFVGKCSFTRGLIYFVAQLLGAFLGSLMLWASVNNLEGLPTYTATGPGDNITKPPFNLGINQLNPGLKAGNGFVFEFMGTLLLCLTVLMTVVHQKSMANGKPHNAPIAIGFAVMLAHIVLIPYTGCGINPARTFGPALANSCAGVPASIAWGSYWWIYWVGPYTAAVVAALIYRALFECDAEDEEEPAPPQEPVKEPGPSRDVEAGKAAVESSKVAQEAHTAEQATASA
eukprot:CAMPEP_0204828330 /NCGR_PEP_ID=MMETSP1346-20131115/6031_1 /ASSEMBLY_ACC=CAM_ASM_000771 /TAXON_ID=215587 /ORGANISM="Aplanochytrium stocchinoi, Strain GSBS06" /LENGTH=318 /DNA_ID=CAMNT_0051957309 /DNA_START=144 /DNA_END=1100 /DNA_ORIENTATION=+